MMYFAISTIKMLISLTLWLTANILSVRGQDCGTSNLFLDPGQVGINADETIAGYDLTFPMPVTIFNNRGDTLYVSVWSDATTCLDVSGTPDCNNDFSVKPTDMSSFSPIIERGIVYYRHSTNQNELIYLRHYLCPDFITRQAVVITYFCLGEISGDRSLTVQVVVVTGEDTEGVNRTVVLVNMALFWDQEEGAFSSIGRTPYRHWVTLFTNDTKGYDVTFITQWSAPHSDPEIPQSCPLPTTIKCIVKHNSEVTMFDGSKQNVTNGKQILAQWNPGKNDCKFKLVAQIQGNTIIWVRFAIGAHKNAVKYSRQLDFNRPSGKIYQRGWKCKAGCKGVITSFDYDISNDGIVYATLKEIDPGNTYVIDTQLCDDANEPNYKMTFNFNANYDETSATVELSREFYDENKDDITGFCVPSV
ncbi:hypothetical protein LSH36_221g00048 [Paralvinella palmiformis]|uniref:Uncharacterized protein n=1 Tax=Paralvinella palmiformis TaxID=53620 RepID=A0AAD9JN48_9ANNE|nr:hypothetical protein LSH36_221g00048 [Paralvinella palmiformis]